MTRHQKAFSLAELLVALGLIAVAILSVLALSIAVARTNQEGIDQNVGNTVSNQVLLRLMDQLRADSPTGIRDRFWDRDFVSTPFESKALTNNDTEFQYEIFARTITDSLGNPMGAATDSRLKKVDIVVRWWDSENQDRQGYGELRVTRSRLVCEAEL